MGQIIIEIPQNVNRTYRIVSEDSAEKLLLNLERLLKKEQPVEDEDILSLWADRKESVEEIARKLKQGWKRK